MGDAATVIEWNGVDVPTEMANVPPGRYRLVAIDDEALSPEVEAKVERGREDARAGRTVSWASVKSELEAKVNARVAK